MKIFVIIIALVLILPGLSACVYSAIYTSRVEKRFPPAGQFVHANGAKTHVIERGTSGPVVLMIHGASANAREFTKRSPQGWKVHTVCSLPTVPATAILHAQPSRARWPFRQSKWQTS